VLNRLGAKMTDKKLSRTTPIRVVEVPGYHPSLNIYEIEASQFWQARCRIGKVRKRQSLKIDLKRQTAAERAAGEWYTDLLTKKAMNQPLIKHRSHTNPANNPSEFYNVAAEFRKAQEGRIRDEDISNREVVDLDAFLKKDLKFFSGTDVKNINFALIQKYKDSLESRNLAGKTIRKHFHHIRGVLKHAHQVGYLDRIPTFPVIKSKRTKIIGWLEKKEYASLISTIKKEIVKGTVVDHVPITAELLYLTEFLLLSFLRPPDIIHMKNNQVSILEQDGLKVLQIRPDSKVAETIVISMPACVEVYEALLGSHKEAGLDGPDDYVFYPKFKEPEYSKRVYAKDTMRRHFNHVLEAAKLKVATNQEVRTLYSLRHSRIMYTLMDNPLIDLKTLADNCRTSIAMLDEHYLEHVKNRLNIEKITGVKKPLKKKRAEEILKKAEDIKTAEMLKLFKSIQ
jgi:hypothetical protein